LKRLLFDPTVKGVFRMNYTTTRKGKKSSNQSTSGCTRRKIPTDDLEALFVEELKGTIFSPESVAEQLVGVDTESPSGRASLRTSGMSTGSSVLEGDKLYRLYLDGKSPARNSPSGTTPLQCAGAVGPGSPSPPG
jgi:hypothetical protein